MGQKRANLVAPSRRHLGIAVALTALAGCLATDSSRPLGRQCVADGECGSTLRCVYGRCRQQCTTDRDCGSGAACVPSADERRLYVCTLPEESGGTACPEGLADDGTGLCRRRCEPDVPLEESCGPAQTCSLGWCRVEAAADGGVPGPGDAMGDGAGEETGRPGAPGNWVLIDVSGTPFTMGSPPEELGRNPNEVQHQVLLTRNFWLMATEITQEQFVGLMGYDPRDPGDPECGPTCPVVNINRHEVTAYANALSAAEDLVECYRCEGARPDWTCVLSPDFPTPYDCPGYRLPTEAEWEYAARAGTTTATYNGNLDGTDPDFRAESCALNAELDPIAWYCGNSDGTPHPVASKLPNNFGLYDMLGNAWEWCHDWVGPYSAGSDPVGAAIGTYRANRGGSWYFWAKSARAALRGWNSPDTRRNDNGGRLSITSR